MNDLLRVSKLFNGVDLKILDTDIISYKIIESKDGEYIFTETECIKDFGLVLQGIIVIESQDIDGNNNILTKVEKGELFGESYALAGECVKANARSEGDSKVMLINPKTIIDSSISKDIRSEVADEIVKIRYNLISILAKKNIKLTEKIFSTSPKTIKEKLRVYLSLEAKRQESREFYIEYNRQELADYLSVDRSALSKELSNLRREGEIDFNKNWFKIL